MEFIKRKVFNCFSSLQITSCIDIFKIFIYPFVLNISFQRQQHEWQMCQCHYSSSWFKFYHTGSMLTWSQTAVLCKVFKKIMAASCELWISVTQCKGPVTAMIAHSHNSVFSMFDTSWGSTELLVLWSQILPDWWVLWFSLGLWHPCSSQMLL